MTLENSNKGTKVQESSLNDFQLQTQLIENKGDFNIEDNFTPIDDYSHFCMYDDLMGPDNLTREMIDALVEDEEVEDRLRQYFKGKITSSELLVGTEKWQKRKIYNVINDVLYFKSKRRRYYFKLPRSMYSFSPFYSFSSFIKVFELDESFESPRIDKLVGPKESDRYERRHEYPWVEIDGDFAQIPIGAKIIINDYLQILKKYPNIIKYMSHILKENGYNGEKYAGKSDEELQQEVEEFFRQWQRRYPKTDEETFREKRYRKEITILSQETIDSITFVEPVEYVTLEEVELGAFGTFEELLARIDNNLEKFPNQDKKTAKSLKLTL